MSENHEIRSTEGACPSLSSAEDAPAESAAAGRWDPIARSIELLGQSRRILAETNRLVTRLD